MEAISTRKISCEKCGKLFSTTGNRNRHVKSIHTENVQMKEDILTHDKHVQTRSNLSTSEESANVNNLSMSTFEESTANVNNLSHVATYSIYFDNISKQYVGVNSPPTYTCFEKK